MRAAVREAVHCALQMSASKRFLIPSLAEGKTCKKMSASALQYSADRDAVGGNEEQDK